MVRLEGGERRIRVVMRDMDRRKPEGGAGFAGHGLDDDLRVGHIRDLSCDFRRVCGIDRDEETVRRNERREAGDGILQHASFAKQIQERLWPVLARERPEPRTAAACRELRRRESCCLLPHNPRDECAQYI